MADSEIAARITADVGSFSSGVQQAASTAEKSFNSIKVSVGGASTAFDRLGASARAQIQAAIGATSQLGTAAQTAGTQVASGMETASHGTAGFYREIVVLGHEVLTGRFSRIPGSMMVLAERTGNLASIVGALANPFVAAGLAAAGMTAYLGYLAEQAISSAASIETLHDSLTLIGQGLSRPTSELTQFRDNLENTFALGTKDATNLTTAFAGLPNVTTAEAQAMAALAVEIAKAKGEDLGDVAAEIAKAATDGGKAFLDWANKIGIQTEEAKENVTTLEKSGQTSAALKNAIDAVSAAVEAQVGAWTRASGAAQNYINTVAALGEAGAALGLSGQIPGAPTGGMPSRHPPSAGPQTDVDQIRAKQEMQAQMTDELKAREIQLQTAIADTDTKSVAGLNRRIELTKQLAALKFPGDTETAQAQRDQLIHAAERKQPSGGGRATGQASDIQTWRDELQQKLVAEGSFFADSKAEELAFWQQKVTLTAAGSKEQAQVENTIFQLRKQLAVQAERDAIEEQTYAGQSAQADYDRKRALVQAEVELGKLTASQGVAQERTLLDEKWSLDEGYFEKKLAAATNDLEQTKRLEQEEFLAHQKMIADRQQLDLKAAQTSQQSWLSILAPIEAAFQASITGMIQGTQTLKQAVANIGQSILAEFVNLGVQRVAKWLATELTITQITETASTVRDAAELGGGFLAGIGKMLTSWLGLETAKTAATTAGAATRSAAETAGSLAGLAGMVASGFAQISIDAAVAAAGAFAATASIPIVGPAAAPAAAAAAYAETIGWAAGMGGGIASAAGGWVVPTDQLANVHKNEMILPAGLSNFVRGSAAAASGGIGGGHTFNFHVTAWDAKSVTAAGPQIVSAINKAIRNGSPIRSS